MSHIMTKPTNWHVRPAKTQISLGIRPVWSESSLCAQWVAKDPSVLHADSEDSDQTGRMPMLIWIFAGRTCHFVGFVTRRLLSVYYTCINGSLILPKRTFRSSYNRTSVTPVVEQMNTVASSSVHVNSCRGWGELPPPWRGRWFLFVSCGHLSWRN